MTVEDLLVVGTLGGGGIHRYVDAQRENLEDHLNVSVYDMHSDPGGEGVAWVARSVVLVVLAALRFPLRRRPDVVHVHTSQRYSFVRASYYVLVAAYLWRRPVVLHVHGSSFDRFVDTDSRALRWLQSTVFGATDAVVVLSEYWREALAGLVPDDRIRVIPNAVDPGAYDAAFDADPPHVVFLSNLYERKGVPAFVEAVTELLDGPAPDVRVSVAGDGPLADDVVALAERHEAVTYHGYVSEAEKRALLSSGSIYVLPAHAEGMPIAILEAMAGGNAVVTTPVGSIPEVIGSENGRLVEPGDPDGLSTALSDLAGDPELVERMGRTNRALAAERYAWEGVGETLRSLYEDVAADGDAGTTGGRGVDSVQRADGGPDADER